MIKEATIPQRSNRPESIELSDAVYRFTRLYQRWMRRRLKLTETSAPRMTLLGILYRNGPQPMNALSEEMEISPRSITALVDGLVSKALVRREPHPTDRRSTLILLTEDGERFSEQVNASFTHLSAELFDELTTEDAENLLRILKELILRGRVDDGEPIPDLRTTRAWIGETVE